MHQEHSGLSEGRELYSGWVQDGVPSKKSSISGQGRYGFRFLKKQEEKLKMSPKM